MADHDNVDNPTASGALQTSADNDSQTPADNNSSHQPEWTSQQLMAMLRNGQVLSPEDQQRLEAHLQRLRTQRTLAQELAGFENPDTAQKTKKRTRPSRRHDATPNSSDPSHSDSDTDADADAALRKRHRLRGPRIRTIQTLKHTANLHK
jgi:hypothetical protein